jgi:hypothetical protein
LSLCGPKWNWSLTKWNQIGRKWNHCSPKFVLSGSKKKGNVVTRQLRCSVILKRGAEVCANGRGITSRRLEGALVKNLFATAVTSNHIESMMSRVLAGIAALRATLGNVASELAARKAVVARLIEAVTKLGGDDALLARYTKEKAKLATLEAAVAKAPQARRHRTRAPRVHTARRRAWRHVRGEPRRHVQESDRANRGDA